MIHKILKIDAELHKRLKLLATQTDQTILELTKQIIKEYLEEKENEK